MHQRGMSDKSMADKLILPQNTRLMGVLLGFIGGSLDVFVISSTIVWWRHRLGTFSY